MKMITIALIMLILVILNACGRNDPNFYYRGNCQVVTGNVIDGSPNHMECK